MTFEDYNEHFDIHRLLRWYFVRDHNAPLVTLWRTSTKKSLRLEWAVPWGPLVKVVPKAMDMFYVHLNDHNFS